MRYRPAPSIPHPALLGFMLLLMVLFMSALPRMVFAAEPTSIVTETDTLPRYTLTPKEIGQKVADAIVEAGLAEIVEATVEVDDPHTVYGADEPIQVEVSGLLADSKNKKWSANIVFKNGDRVISAIPMQGKFLAMVELPALTKPYTSGKIITAEDISIQKFPNHFSKNDVVTTADALVGKAVRRNISANRPIREHEVASALVMKKNDIIQINYSSNNLHITTSGQVLADAAVGDMVEIRNTNSNHVVRAVVQDSRNANVLPFVQTSALGGNNAKIN